MKREGYERMKAEIGASRHKPRDTWRPQKLEEAKKDSPLTAFSRNTALPPELWEKNALVVLR